MTNRITRLLCTGLCISFFLFSPTAMAAAQSTNFPVISADVNSVESTVAPTDLNQFANTIVRDLSLQAPFHEWKNATLDTQPLGPGTHAWIVTIVSRSSASNGYLIIGAKPEGGYALIEYGLGANPLFSDNMQNQLLSYLGELKRNGTDYQIEKRYGGPALVEWRVTTKLQSQPPQYFDAVSGELLPETDASWSMITKTGLATTGLISSERRHSPPGKTEVTAKMFSTYENLAWMNQQALSIKPHLFAAQLKQKKKLVFASKGAERTFSTSLPVNGYQVWTSSGTTESIYVLSKSGSLSRWIALVCMQNMGEFYETSNK